MGHACAVDGLRRQGWTQSGQQSLAVFRTGPNTDSRGPHCPRSDFFPCRTDPGPEAAQLVAVGRQAWTEPSGWHSCVADNRSTNTFAGCISFLGLL